MANQLFNVNRNGYSYIAQELNSALAKKSNKNQSCHALVLQLTVVLNVFDQILINNVGDEF